jgi:hypothetical protein
MCEETQGGAVHIPGGTLRERATLQEAHCGNVHVPKDTRRDSAHTSRDVQWLLGGGVGPAAISSLFQLKTAG